MPQAPIDACSGPARLFSSFSQHADLDFLSFVFNEESLELPDHAAPGADLTPPLDDLFPAEGWPKPNDVVPQDVTYARTSTVDGGNARGPHQGAVEPATTSGLAAKCMSLRTRNGRQPRRPSESEYCSDLEVSNASEHAQAVNKRKKPDIDLSTISDPEERKKQKRLAKNRRTAAISRERKRAQVDHLQEQLTVLQAENAQLKGALQQKELEIKRLSSRLASPSMGAVVKAESTVRSATESANTVANSAQDPVSDPVGSDLFDFLHDFGL